MTTSLPTYKKAVTEDKLNASLQLQMAELPDSGLEMSASEMCEKIRAYLWTAELARVNGMKGGLPLYPMEWEVRGYMLLLGQCTV